MGNIMGCCLGQRRDNHGSKSKEEATAHRLVSKLFSYSNRLKNNQSISVSSDPNKKIVQIYTRVTEIICDKVPAEYLAAFLSNNPELWKEISERLLTLDEVRLWLLSHPHAFDMLMKDMHMESTVKWIQLKQDLIEKAKLQGQGSSSSKSPSLSNIPHSFQTNSIFKSSMLNDSISHDLNTSTTTTTYQKDTTSNSLNPLVVVDSRSKASLRLVPASRSHSDHSTKSLSEKYDKNDLIVEHLLGDACKRLLDASLNGASFVLEEILLQVWQICEASSVVLFHASADKFDWKLIITNENDESQDNALKVSLEEIDIPIQGVVGEAWRSRECLRSSTKDPRYDSKIDFGMSQKEAHLSIYPFIAVSEYSGVIAVYHQEESAKLSDNGSIINILLSLGAKALDVAVQNTNKLIDCKMTEILLEASHQLMKISSVSQAHSLLEQCACHVLDAEVGMFIKFDPSKEYEEDMSEVIRTKEPVLLSKKSNKKGLLLPIILNDQIHGVVLLSRNQDFQNFDLNLARKLTLWMSEFLRGRLVRDIVLIQEIQDCFANPKLNQVIMTLKEYLKKNLQCSNVDFYMPKHTIDMDAMKKCGILEIESGIVRYTAEKEMTQMHSKAIPRKFNDEEFATEESQLAAFIRLSDKFSMVVRCGRHEPFLEHSQSQLEQILMLSSMGIRISIQREIEEKKARRQKLALEIFLGDSESVLERSHRTLQSESSTASTGHFRQIDELESGASYEMNKVKIIPLITALLNPIIQTHQIDVNTELLGKFLGQSSLKRKDHHLSAVANRLQFFTTLIKSFEHSESLRLKAIETIAIAFALILCEPSSIKDSYQESDKGSITITSSLTSLHELTDNRSMYLIRYFYRQDVNIFANMEEQTFRQFLQQLKELSSMSLRSKISDLIKSLDHIIRACTNEKEKFQEYFDPQNDATHKKILCNLVFVCSWYSLFSQPWKNAAKWIQYFTKLATATDNDSDADYRMRNGLSREIGCIDTTIAPCFELLKIIVHKSNERNKNSHETPSFIDESFNQLLSNRKKLEEILAEEVGMVEGSLESFIAEEFEL